MIGHADDAALDAPELFPVPRLADVVTSADATSVPTSALFCPRQWNLRAVFAARLGHGNPAQVRARILQSADDLGEPGHDPYYGAGRINIVRALDLIDP